MTTSSNEPAQPSMRKMVDEIFQLGAAVSSPAELRAFLSEVSTLAIGIGGGLENAAWRGHLTEGAPIDDRPGPATLQDQLRRGDLDKDNASLGHAALGQDILAAIRAAQTLHDITSAAWAASVAEDTRLVVEEAHAKRSADNLNYYKDMMAAVGDALSDAVPAEHKQAALAALEREMTAVRQRHANK